MASSLSSVPPVWPKRAARNHRYYHTGRGSQWGGDQAGFIAHATSGMLVDFNARDGGKVDMFPGSHHPFG